MNGISNDVLEGSCCCVCMAYFLTDDGEGIATHGHPAICKECWEEWHNANPHAQKASYKTIGESND